MSTPTAVVVKATPREQELIDLLCEGVGTDKELADKMGIALATLQVHMASVFRKYDVHNRVGLVVKVYKMRLASMETAT